MGPIYDYNDVKYLKLQREINEGNVIHHSLLFSTFLIWPFPHFPNLFLFHTLQSISDELLVSSSYKFQCWCCCYAFASVICIYCTCVLFLLHSYFSIKNQVMYPLLQRYVAAFQSAFPRACWAVQYIVHICTMVLLNHFICLFSPFKL